MGLAKRANKAAENAALEQRVQQESAQVPERRYVSLEEAAAPQKARLVRDDRNDLGAPAAVQGDRREVVGPGGLLERSMIGGYEHRVGQLEIGGVGGAAVAT